MFDVVDKLVPEWVRYPDAQYLRGQQNVGVRGMDGSCAAHSQYGDATVSCCQQGLSRLGLSTLWGWQVIEITSGQLLVDKIHGPLGILPVLVGQRVGNAPHPYGYCQP